MNKKQLSFLIRWLLITLSVIAYIVVRYMTTEYKIKLDEELLPLIYISKSAQQLPKNGSLFCWAQTSSKYHTTRATAINETWLKRCDHGQLFTNSIFEDENIPYSTVFAGIPDTYKNLFHKTRFAFHYIWRYISKDFDWYLKADDDTYVIVENLRQFLAALDPNEPHYIGYSLKNILKNGFNSGGAGYIFSRKALEMFDNQLYLNETLCPHDVKEDVGIGRCLANIGIYPEDTRNEKGQNRFYFDTPKIMHDGYHINGTYMMYSETRGMSAFANDLISFHYITPDEIRTFDMLLYRVNVDNNKEIVGDP